jgi:hypothetical protein
MGKRPRERQTAKASAFSVRQQIPVSYNDITNHLLQAGSANPTELRQKTLKCIEEMTGRPIICYVAKSLNNPVYILPTLTRLDEATSIDDNDILGFTDLIESIPGEKLDVLLVSNGGSPLTAERIVKMLRQQFTHIRFIIPANAFSAATMICFSGDEIIMNAQSSTLGPVDPQFGGVPIRAVLRGMEEIERRVKEEGSTILDIYRSLIDKFSIPFLEICKSAWQLSEELTKEWLKDYMFKDELAKGTIQLCEVEKIATTFLNYDELKDHGRSINRGKAQGFGLKVINIEDISGLGDLIRSVYNQYEKWFEISPFFKMYENTRGISWGRYTKTNPVMPSSSTQEPHPQKPQEILSGNPEALRD